MKWVIMRGVVFGVVVAVVMLAGAGESQAQSEADYPPVNSQTDIIIGAPDASTLLLSYVSPTCITCLYLMVKLSSEPFMTHMQEGKDLP